MAYEKLLVIANETIVGERLHRQIAELVAPGGRVIIIAPALSGRLKYVFSDVDEPREQARKRLDDSIRALAEDGVVAEGEVGDVNPVRACEDAIAIYEPDAILVSTHPPGRSHWLENNLIEKIRTKTDLPVEHVVVDLAAADAEHKLASRG
jgi:hypothetical protein